MWNKYLTSIMRLCLMFSHIQTPGYLHFHQSSIVNNSHLRWMNILAFNIHLIWMKISTESATGRYNPLLNQPNETSCVNWNQYYTNCSQLGNNPFQGTISFDNIGLAWVAIFLVSFQRSKFHPFIQGSSSW